METLSQEKRLAYALKNDPRAKAWICPNEPLFSSSLENSDLFLTTYRIRNAYEHLLNRLEEGEEIRDEKDMVLIQRLFDMDFPSPKRLSLSAWKEGKETSVKILKAYKDRRWKASRRRPFEVSLELDNGKRYQINPNEILSRFMHIRRTYDSLVHSTL